MSFFSRALLCYPSLLILSCSGALASGELTTLNSGETMSGGGIVLPSIGTALRTNPAGLGDQLNPLRIGMITSQREHASSPNLGVQASLRVWELTLGALVQQQKQGRGSPVTTFIRDGISLQLPLGLTVGFATSVYDEGHERPNKFDWGALWNIGSSLRLGVNVTDGYTYEAPRKWGLGVAGEISSGFVLSLDTARDLYNEGQAFYPGLKIGNRFSEFTVGYGSGDANQFNKGLSVGGSFELIRHTRFEIRTEVSSPKSRGYHDIYFGIFALIY